MTFGVAVIPSGALVTRLAHKVVLASALSRVVAVVHLATDFRTTARYAEWISVEASSTSITARSTEVLLADAPPAVLVAEVGLASTHITVTLLACRVIEESSCALSTVAPAVVWTTPALTQADITVSTNRPDTVALTRFAVWEVIVSISALVTVEAIVVRLARTLAATNFTHLSLCPVHMALAWYAPRVAIVTDIAPLTGETAVLRAAGTTACSLLTVTGRKHSVTSATLADSG